jgi:crotonobetainyl-CoA:carnitine CoA-transferase CaiB-like acyl-CoA transferase
MGVFPASDGLVNVAASGDRMFRDFLRVIDAEALADDERFATPRARAGHRPELREAVETHTRKYSCNELIERLNDVGVPCGPILTIDKVFEDPQVQHLALAQTVQSPTYGPLDLVRAPVRLSRTSTSLRSAAPRPGADTEAVLREAGYTPAEIAALEKDGVAGVPG